MYVLYYTCTYNTISEKFCYLFFVYLIFSLSIYSLADLI